MDVCGYVRRTDQKIVSCSQQDVELHVEEAFVVSAAEPVLPLQIEDAARSDFEIKVKLSENCSMWLTLGVLGHGYD